MPTCTPPFTVSRRLLLSTAPAAATSTIVRPDFDIWWDQHQRHCAMFDATPETQEDLRNHLLDRIVEFEELIVRTPGSWAAAVRAKVRILHWLMVQERHDAVLAIGDIHRFVLRST